MEELNIRDSDRQLRQPETKLICLPLKLFYKLEFQSLHAAVKQPNDYSRTSCLSIVSQTKITAAHSSEYENKQRRCMEYEIHTYTRSTAHALTRAHMPTSFLVLSHQTAGCLRSRNQCLLDSLDWGPLFPRDSRVMIGPANTHEHRHMGTQQDTDSNYTNRQLQDKACRYTAVKASLAFSFEQVFPHAVSPQDWEETRHVENTLPAVQVQHEGAGPSDHQSAEKQTTTTQVAQTVTRCYNIIKYD